MHSCDSGYHRFFDHTYKNMFEDHTVFCFTELQIFVVALCLFANMSDQAFLMHCAALQPIFHRCTAEQRAEHTGTLGRLLDAVPNLTDGTAAMTALSKLQLNQTEQAELFNKVGSKVAMSKVGSLVLQNYTNLWTCIPPKLWQELREMSPSKALATLCAHCWKLGMRTPSEPSVQVLTACFIEVQPRSDV